MKETDKQIFEKDAKDYLGVFNRYKIVMAKAPMFGTIMERNILTYSAV